jgi:molybdate/tungstate transport system ATP-binding protein
MIRLDGVTLRVGTFALENVSFTVPAQRYAVLMGRSGSGKTSLLEAVAGLRATEAGRIELLGRDVTRLKAADRGVGYVPQDLALFPTMTVREHLAFALVVRGREAGAVAARVRELSELLGIGGLLERRPQGLSGGEAQRVALGRALSFSPKVLLLDEPLSALDEEAREELYTLLRSVHRETRVTVLHVTHNLREGKALADYFLWLEGGVVRERV